jgi:RimJ/RimL family protein N-acetyltransferase
LSARAISFRSTVESDIDRFIPLLRPDGACAVSEVAYRAKLADRQFRLEHTWIAEGAGEVLAVAVWWAGLRDHVPGALDAIYVRECADDDRIALAAQLLRAAQDSFATQLGVAEPPAYHVFVPVDWRDRADVVAALDWRREAARRVGLGVSLERLQYRWTVESGLPQTAGRLTFRAEPDDEVFVELFARVLEGSLDTTSTREAASVGAEEQARADVAFYRDSMLGERAWWRVAYSADGERVGFGFPSRNPSSHVIGYLGVLPEHRGHGYVGEILAELTRMLAQEVGATTVTADTDLVNVPMAAAFERAGYLNFSRRLVYSAS